MGHDILAGKNVKQAVKGRSIEAVTHIAQQGAKQLRNLTNQEEVANARHL